MKATSLFADGFDKYLFIKTFSKTLTFQANLTLLPAILGALLLVSHSACFAQAVALQPGRPAKKGHTSYSRSDARKDYSKALENLTPARPDPPILILLGADPAQNIGRFEFGTMTLLDHPQIAHTFQLRNNTAAPLVLTRLQPSCRCTTALVEPDLFAGNGNVLPTLAPGQQATVRVTVAPEPFQTGPLDKTVQVYAEGHDQPVATLEMRGTLLPSLILEPRVLDFGRVAAGHLAARTMTVKIDTRLLPNGRGLRLVSTNPDVQITALPKIVARHASLPVAAGVPLAMLSLTYHVTLAPDASLGPVQGILRLISTATSSNSDLSTAPVVLMTGQVNGVASALPSALSFGPVQPGQPVTRQLRLVGTSFAILQLAGISTFSPYLSVRRGPIMPESSSRGINDVQPASQVLDITLSADAPLGLVQTQLRVTLFNGQHLLIPISANVSDHPGF